MDKFLELDIKFDEIQSRVAEFKKLQDNIADELSEYAKSLNKNWFVQSEINIYNYNIELIQYQPFASVSRRLYGKTMDDLKAEIFKIYKTEVN